MMTRKDYKVIAEALRGCVAYCHTVGRPLDISDVVASLSTALRLDNPRFSPERFRRAVCGVQPAPQHVKRARVRAEAKAKREPTIVELCDPSYHP